uniref:Tail specific protease domain-containing protein n=1 Tax=Globisporangium ultimum (strain ATCC 200006 / CBS 805.95 / DAOM BR144) TaxID=431595 RepID=K3WWL8_GLOUD
MSKATRKASSSSWLPSLPLASYLSVSTLLGTAPYAILESLILWPLELYESLAILPVSFLRRHMPLLGGTLVVLMTLHGILLRLFLEVMHTIFARITYSNDPVFNFRTFWIGMRDRYAFMELRQVDWNFVHQLFGDAMQPSTSEDDLWIALQESISLCNDSSLSISRGGGFVTRGKTLSATSAAAKQYEQAALAVIERNHLTDGGRHIANHFVCGIMNAETSPGWRIGYICLNSMAGFVDFPMPRADSLVPSWSASQDPVVIYEGKSNVVVPEIYDLESMRWALEAILKSLGDIDGLILDLRFNQGGGSLLSSLSVASYFAGAKRSVAFSIDEKLPGGNTQRFSKPKKYYIPNTSRSFRYRGPLVVLQSQYTRGTAELLCLSLRKRVHTCSVGSTTAGSLSSTRKLRLPNYWTVEIPHQRCFSADGELFEGVGIPPDKEISEMVADASKAQKPAAAASPVKMDPCVKKAVEHIMNL